MKLTSYKQDGTKGSEVTLPETVFDVPMNADLLHQAVRVLSARRRRTTAHTKTRSDVRGGGRKPWAQKGTGRARHGSIRSPLWRGGGATFGPRRDRNFTLQMPKAMRVKALAVALSAKAKDGEIAVLEAFDLPEAKTKTMATMLKSVSTKAFPQNAEIKREPSILFALPKHDEKVARAMKNIQRVSWKAVSDITALDVMESKYIVFEQSALVPLADRFGAKTEAKPAKSAVKKTEEKPAKPAAKPAAKKEEAKKAPAKKAAPKKTTVKKAAPKKPATKKPTQKKETKAKA